MSTTTTATPAEKDIPSEHDENSARDNDPSTTQMTCDVLCSLGDTSSAPHAVPVPSAGVSAPSLATSGAAAKKRKQSPASSLILQTMCSKQHQLPMFLSKTYHMIDRCDAEIATWSETGDNFVVKNVERFASSVLPLYFKHSNFSSFARQLNFYGFRKLRSETILTNDVDPRTACYVRFYHENFQKDKPELLHHIKRATKATEQTNSDEFQVLKMEVQKLKEDLSKATVEYDRKLAEVSYDCNRRISSMMTEYDKLALLVQQTLGVATAAAAPGATAAAPPPVLHAASAGAAAAASQNLLHSLSQAAISLQSHLRPNGAAMLGLAAAPVPPPGGGGASSSSKKRPAATEGGANGSGGVGGMEGNKKARAEDGTQS